MNLIIIIIIIIIIIKEKKSGTRMCNKGMNEFEYYL